MKSIFAATGAFVLAFILVGAIGGTSQASPAASTVLEVCEKQNEKIPAEKLPSTLKLDKCPVESRPIVDNGVGVDLPEPGSGVHVEALSTAGVQELVVARSDDGELELSKVGDDTEEAEASSQNAEPVYTENASGPNQCRDRAYNLTRWKVYRAITYQYNYNTTPPYLNRRATARQIQRGGANIVGTRNICGVGDLVESGIGFRGNTRRQAQVSADGQCTGNDGASVVSFGRLGGRTLGLTCTYFQTRQGFDRVIASDIKLDRSATRWSSSSFQGLGRAVSLTIYKG